MSGNKVPEGMKRLSLNLPMELYEYVSNNGDSYESFTAKIIKMIKADIEKPILKRMFQIMDGSMKFEKGHPTEDTLEFIDEVMILLKMKESD